MSYPNDPDELSSSQQTSSWAKQYLAQGQPPLRPGQNPQSPLQDLSNGRRDAAAPQQSSPQSGCPQQGYSQQTDPQQGYSQSGHPQQSYPQQGYPQQGYSQSGYPQQPDPQQGYRQSGYPQQPDPQQGYRQSSYPQQPDPQQGYRQSGYPQQPDPQQGYRQSGYPQQTYPQSSYPPQRQPVAVQKSSGGLVGLLIGLGLLVVVVIGVIVFLLLRSNSGGEKTASADSVPPAVSDTALSIPSVPSTASSSETQAPAATAATETAPPQTAAPTTEPPTTEPPTTETSRAWLDQLNRRYGNYFDFTPDENGFVIPDSSTRQISRSELYSMTEHQVCMARNEIYARNGYTFSDSKYSDYYESFSWYRGYTKDPVLTDLEKSNLDIIKAYEKDMGW